MRPIVAAGLESNRAKAAREQARARRAVVGEARDSAERRRSRICRALRTTDHAGLRSRLFVELDAVDALLGDLGDVLQDRFGCEAAAIAHERAAQR